METHLSEEVLIQLINEKYSEYKETLNKFRSLNEELYNLNNKLLSSEKFKTHFLSYISSKILSHIHKITELATIILKTDDYKIKKEAASLILERSLCLDLQIRNVTFASEIELGIFQPHIKAFNPKSIIDKLTADYASRITSRNIEFTIKDKIVDKELIIEFDEEAYQLIMQNVMEFSIKHNSDSEQILIEYDLNEGKFILKITVKKKLNSQILNTIFDYYEIVRTGGNLPKLRQNLGMPVSYTLLKILGGDLIIESSGEQTRLSVFIPTKLNHSKTEYNTNEYKEV